MYKNDNKILESGNTYNIRLMEVIQLTLRSIYLRSVLTIAVLTCTVAISVHRVPLAREVCLHYQ